MDDKWHKLLTGVPVDRVARRVTSQQHAAVGDTPLTRDELIALIARTARKQRLLKQVLGIKTKAQHTNVVYKASKNVRQVRAMKEPRSLSEYLRCGKEIQRLSQELAALRQLRQFVGEAERETRALQTLLPDPP